jgi:hypothetical protein
MIGLKMSRRMEIRAGVRFVVTLFCQELNVWKAETRKEEFGQDRELLGENYTIYQPLS